MSQRHVVDRRQFITAATVAVPLVAAACSSAPSTDGHRVRVASVSTPVDGGLLPQLLETFQAATSIKVELTVGADEVYDRARAGQADLVISHYGHKHAEAFVMAGYGAWPRTLFSNQLALVGPPSDPARVDGLTDAVEAFSRIAKARAPFVVNDLDGVRYATEILWHGAGRPPREGWWLEGHEKKADAMALAAEKGAYTIWGLTPFLREQKSTPRALKPLVVGDPLLQRLLVSIAVRADKVPGVNAAGAEALEQFLLEPSTLARIRATRYPGVPLAAWAPAGRHNRTELLPKA
ncbi:MAG TPA: substrate-binding domain-containing protein [Minicystis sp.]|nr:substrate-binding domain-containing protein [Minicystis sp.]